MLRVRTSIIVWIAWGIDTTYRETHRRLQCSTCSENVYGKRVLRRTKRQQQYLELREAVVVKYAS